MKMDNIGELKHQVERDIVATQFSIQIKDQHHFTLNGEFEHNLKNTAREKR